MRIQGPRTSASQNAPAATHAAPAATMAHGTPDWARLGSPVAVTGQARMPVCATASAMPAADTVAPS